jgi:hypothetical protein
MKKMIIGVLVAAGAVVLLASGCYYETAGHAVPNPTSVVTTPASTAVAAPATNAPATNAPTTNAPATNAPTAKPRLQPGPHSWIADVDLPDGTVQCTTWECSDIPLTNDPHVEYWRYSAPYNDTVAFLRDRFATGPRYDANGATWWKGLPPCYNTAHQSPPSGWTDDDRFNHWLWSDGARWLEVVVHKPGSAPGSAPFGVMDIAEGFVSELSEPVSCYRA